MLSREQERQAIVGRGEDPTHPPQLQALQHQRCRNAQEGDLALRRCLAQGDRRGVTFACTDHEEMPDAHPVANERPVAADLDGVSIGGVLHRLGQRVELSFRDALAANYHEGARLRLRRLRPELFRLLEPLLILRRLPPAFVGRAGADEVHVGAEVLAVLARFVAGAVGRKRKSSGVNCSGVRSARERKSPLW